MKVLGVCAVLILGVFTVLSAELTSKMVGIPNMVYRTFFKIIGEDNIFLYIE